MKKFILAIFLISPVLIYGCQKGGNTDSNSNNKEQGAEQKATAQNAQKDKGDKAAIHINEQQFKEQIMNFDKHDTWQFKGDKPCLVDFYADWCAPCRITSPILEDLAKEYKGQINVYKVDIEKEKKLASVFGVRSIPTFLYCPTEGKPTKASGIGRSKQATKEMFKKNIEQFLLNK